MPKFHNPYNFIPAPPLKNPYGVLGRRGSDEQDDFDRFGRADTWTGRLRVELTVATPLLLPDAAQVTVAPGGHAIYQTRTTIDRDNRTIPYLAATGLKGALRSAFEAVTDSRMAAAPSTDKRYAYRQLAGVALGMVPAIVTADGERLELLTGCSRGADGGFEPNNPATDGTPTATSDGRIVQYAAWWPAYGVGRNAAPLPLPDHEALPEGSELQVTLQMRERPVHNGQPAFRYWQVVAWRREETDNWNRIDGQARHETVDGVADFLAWGYLHRTNRSFGRKHDERFFFYWGDFDPAYCALTTELRASWADTTRSFHEAHSDHDRRGRGPGRADWSPYVLAQTAQLGPGDLCYVSMHQGQPRALHPVMIGRQLFPSAPQVPNEIRPAVDDGSLSPAERVFGWVPPKGGSGARRGRVRIGPVHAGDVCGIDTTARRLKILGQPKPQQGRFYAAASPSGEPLPRNTDKASWFTDNRGIRGRKVYPHHRAFSEAGATTTNQSNQNRTVVGAVTPGSTFVVDLFLDQISSIDLGALLWILGVDGGHLRLGYGKPLGFGSVSTRIDLNGSSLTYALSMTSRWSKLGTTPPSLTAGQRDVAIDDFHMELDLAIGQPAATRVLRAYENAARGPADGAPITYPTRADQGPNAGEQFRWFVQNEGPNGAKVSLPALADGPPPMDQN